MVRRPLTWHYTVRLSETPDLDEAMLTSAAEELKLPKTHVEVLPLKGYWEGYAMALGAVAIKNPQLSFQVTNPETLEVEVGESGRWFFRIIRPL